VYVNLKEVIPVYMTCYSGVEKKKKPLVSILETDNVEAVFNILISDQFVEGSEVKGGVTSITTKFPDGGIRLIVGEKDQIEHIGRMLGMHQYLK
jgi:hypothetical protein